MPEGALSYRTPDMNRMRESDQAEEAVAVILAPVE